MGEDDRVSNRSDSRPDQPSPRQAHRALLYLKNSVLVARNYWALALLAAILVLAAVVRVYDSTDNPPGFFCDEAAYGYNAYSILHTAKDEYGETLPLFFRSFGEYKLPVYIYSQTPLIAILGLSELPVRLATAIYGVLTVAAVYLLVRILFREQGMALAAAAILAILPWHIHYSRTGFGEVIAVPFFLVLSLYLFILGTRRPLYWLATAVALVLTLYSYRSAWVTVPPLAAILIALYHREIAKHWRISLASLVILVVASIPILTQILLVESDRSREQSLFTLDVSVWEKIKTFFDYYRLHFTNSFLFEGTAEGNIRHYLPHFGHLYTWQLPFIILGLLALLWKPSRPKLLVLALLLVYPLGAALSSTSPSGGRAIIGTLAFSIITAYGVMALLWALTRWQRPQSLKVAGLGLAMIAVFATAVAASWRFTSYLDAYHGTYSQIAADYWGWQWGARDIIQRFLQVEDEYDQLVMDGAFNAPDIFIRFYAPNDCSNCIIGDWDKYDPSKKQLFALRPENAWSTYGYDMKDTLYYPNGELAFVLVEITGRQEPPRGNLPFENLGDPAASISSLDKAIALEPDNALAYASRGAAYLSLGNPERALEDLNKAIELDPNLALAYANRGNANWNLDRFRDAFRDFDKAVELDPKLALAHYNRGNAYAARGAYQRAVDSYNSAIVLDMSLAQAYNNRGHAYNELGAYDQAIADLDEAVALDPNLAVAYANRGYTLLKQANLQLALSDLDRAIQLDPALALAYVNRARVYVELGAYDQAIPDLAMAIGLDPHYAEAYNTQGLAYVGLGELEWAITDLDRAIELNRDYASAYANRGIAYLELGDLERALQDFDKAILLDWAYVAAPSEWRNTDWMLSDPERLVADLTAALSLARDPDLVARLQQIIDYLAQPP